MVFRPLNPRYDKTYSTISLLFSVKRCPRCGEENEDDANFCIRCGYGFKTSMRYVILSAITYFIYTALDFFTLTEVERIPTLINPESVLIFLYSYSGAQIYLISVLSLIIFDVSVWSLARALEGIGTSAYILVNVGFKLLLIVEFVGSLILFLFLQEPFLGSLLITLATLGTLTLLVSTIGLSFGTYKIGTFLQNNAIKLLSVLYLIPLLGFLITL
ncbi:zinc-ribbon domain-containing protein [Sulfolobus metallicus DSM 6482 = JCM 9184]|uniref:Zinc-ribbon domain-containing protein n=1 Tax=Sulfuracidifex metallicus DSM 6482 = JCM 9184 TaxID=523847 RepID=A0A6A9QL29_SULME|nr:zinc-ribbon domain-containing protein [Sulfuracidifex metallicus DSM 6482 = JCM 9184]